MDWRVLATELLAAVDRLGESEIHVAGHSVGASLCLLSELERPGTFASMWLFEPLTAQSESVHTEVDDRRVDKILGRRSEFVDVDDAVEWLSTRKGLRACEPETLWSLMAIGLRSTNGGPMTLSCTPEIEARVVLGRVRIPYEDLDAVRCSVKVVRGDVQPPRRHRMFQFTEALAEALPRGQLETLRGLTHLGPMEDSESIAASILDTHRP